MKNKKRFPGKVVKQVISDGVKKPATLDYPADKSGMPKGFRGKIKFNPANCVGCLLCCRDCPSGAIAIKKTGDKQYEAHIDLAKCIYCAQCVDSCMKKALEYSEDFELAQISRAKLKIICSNRDLSL